MGQVSITDIVKGHHRTVLDASALVRVPYLPFHSYNDEVFELLQADSQMEFPFRKIVTTPDVVNQVGTALSKQNPNSYPVPRGMEKLLLRFDTTRLHPYFGKALEFVRELIRGIDTPDVYLDESYAPVIALALAHTQGDGNRSRYAFVSRKREASKLLHEVHSEAKAGNIPDFPFRVGGVLHLYSQISRSGEIVPYNGWQEARGFHSPLPKGFSFLSQTQNKEYVKQSA